MASIKGIICSTGIDFYQSTRPDWLYWREASHLLGLLVQIAHLHGVRTIFAAAFDTDVHPATALTARQRWWPLYAWGLSRTERLFVQHGGQLERLTIAMETQGSRGSKYCRSA